MATFEELKARFPNLRPIQGAPVLFRINGCGFSVVGTRDRDPATGTYLTTYVFCIVFIPVLALTAYRVADAPGGGQYYLGREDLSGFAKGWNMLLAAMVSFFIVLVAVGAYLSPEGSEPNRPLASPRPSGARTDR